MHRKSKRYMQREWQRFITLLSPYYIYLADELFFYTWLAVCALGSLSIMGGVQKDGVEWTSRMARGLLYAVESAICLYFFSRDVCKNKVYRIVGEKQCHSINKCILFEITLMQLLNQRIIAAGWSDHILERFEMFRSMVQWFQGSTVIRDCSAVQSAVCLSKCLTAADRAQKPQDMRTRGLASVSCIPAYRLSKWRRTNQNLTRHCGRCQVAVFALRIFQHR